ncbi:hypothetical protein FOXG_22586 [Fusarium oxysporum f. sp. lycopersici 4287]|uniref:Zn(2)-C6 fungal-type domain-containing protein n=2 Tax=Fusarium oxysporum f. sp. lycopersici (strain 4287 / CBS 123668 / FGSC 9935 / NRRL 34936) TaxID=426428 RepID=A0A0J9WAI1_FUSO4|nr:hypothetical protein FOXG_22586 [Fusarium oxysporum f. sp. lycopersici 4287]KAJ9413192.1 hypothetical protein QL093DRAFT_2510451 [Fusarium oxysporum]KNB19506.1 hypothetical protein FOXG_22586 [Fusarium oxysporum f. sp. lycopersici 4287]
MQQINAQVNDLSRIANLQTPSSTNSPFESGPVKAANPSRIVIELSASPPESAKQSSLAHASPRRNSKDPIALSKRTRGPYVAIACNGCRRRKGKCSGGNPCRRCANLKMPCLYNSNTKRNWRLSDEPEELEDMVRRNSPSQRTMELSHQSAGSMQDLSTPEEIPEGMPLAINIPFDDLFLSACMNFGGQPTNQADFPQLDAFGISQHSLHIAEGFDGNSNFTWDFASGGSIERRSYPTKASDTFSDETSFHPLPEFNQDEIIKLCRLYKGGIGSMYPIIDTESLLTFVRTTPLSNLTESCNIVEPIVGLNVLRLKLIICCALTVEGESQNEKADRIYASIRGFSFNMLSLETDGSSSLDLLVLLAIYHILAQNDVLAEKKIWQLGRSCLEKGLHRKPNIDKIHSDEGRKNALTTFWTAYVLDQQLRLNTGLPCVIAEHLIDKELPLPDRDSYLMAIISWTRISAKVSNQWSYRDSSLPSNNSIEIIDTEILEWYRALPEQMKVQSPQSRTSYPNVGAKRLEYRRVLLFFKLLQIRMSLYASVLSSSSSIMMNSQQSERAVSLAKHTIQYLTSLEDVELDYFTKLFHPYLLLSTITILFLASVYAPANIRDNCQEDFKASLGLTASLLQKSWLSQRLWGAIKSLKHVAPRYGLDLNDCHSTAIVREMGLSHEQSPRGQVEQPSVNLPPQLRGQRHPDASLNGRQIQQELSRITEAYVSLGKLGYKADITIFLIMRDLIQGSSFDSERHRGSIVL